MFRLVSGHKNFLSNPHTRLVSTRQTLLASVELRKSNEIDMTRKLRANRISKNGTIRQGRPVFLWGFDYA